MTTRVAIVDDEPDIRDGLMVLIGKAPGFACAGTFASMEELLGRLDDIAADLVLVDLGLPGMSGTEGIRLLKRRQPGLVSVVLTIHADDQRIFEALSAGALGYLLKTTPPARLLDSLRDVMAGGSPMSPEIARRVVALFASCRAPAEMPSALTPHEQRLLTLLVDGHNYKTAALELRVSVNTVSFHMRRIYEKLHVHSKSEAVAKALRMGLIR